MTNRESMSRPANPSNPGSDGGSSARPRPPLDTTRRTLDLAEIPGPVAFVFASARDAGLAAKDLLTQLARRGEAVVLVVATGSEAQAREAAAAWGVREVRTLGLAAGAVGATESLVARLRQMLDELAPHTVVGPDGGSNVDGRALSRALCSSLARGADRTVLLAARGDARALQLEGPNAESFLILHAGQALDATRPPHDPTVPRTTAVVSTWNKKEDVRANLESLRAQTLPFDEIVVVDNASRDGTAAMLAQEFPEVRAIVMPHDRYGACETFNLGFKSVTTELTAILDDDIVMPPDWLEKATRRLMREPSSTAIVSTQVVEPGMPESYRTSPAVNEERYMSTFRGCASLARTDALRAAGYYDERLFIYGNERDLTCRLLNLGHRVLQFPDAHVFHKTPFGIKMGKRSLFYHARNAWLSQLKYAPAKDLVRMPWLVASVLLRGDRKEAQGNVTDAVGTIGIGRSIRETPGAWLVLVKAGFSVLRNVPYCMARRAPCRAPDFELPLH